eukprot:g12222.t1
MMSEDSKKAEEKVAKEASHASSDEKELPPFGDEGFEDSIASLKEVVAMISNGSKTEEKKEVPYASLEKEELPPFGDEGFEDSIAS